MDQAGEFGTVTVRGSVVHAAGEFDSVNGEMLRSALTQVAADVAGEFVIDLTEVTFMDSSTLAVLLDVVDRRPRYRVRAESVAERLLTITGFGLIDLVDIAEAADADPTGGRAPQSR